MDPLYTLVPWLADLERELELANKERASAPSDAGNPITLATRRQKAYLERLEKVVALGRSLFTPNGFEAGFIRESSDNEKTEKKATRESRLDTLTLAARRTDTLAMALAHTLDAKFGLSEKSRFIAYETQIKPHLIKHFCAQIASQSPRMLLRAKPEMSKENLSSGPNLKTLQNWVFGTIDVVQAASKAPTQPSSSLRDSVNAFCVTRGIFDIVPGKGKGYADVENLFGLRWMQAMAISTLEGLLKRQGDDMRQVIRDLRNPSGAKLTVVGRASGLLPTDNNVTFYMWCPPWMAQLLCFSDDPTLSELPPILKRIGWFDSRRLSGKKVNALQWLDTGLDQRTFFFACLLLSLQAVPPL